MHAIRRKILENFWPFLVWKGKDDVYFHFVLLMKEKIFLLWTEKMLLVSFKSTTKINILFCKMMCHWSLKVEMSKWNINIILNTLYVKNVNAVK